jgi:hypothetical protein
MLTIGRKDKVDLPNLGLFDIEVKIDTGAYGCALHCHHISVLEEEGKKVLTFKVLDPTHPEYEDKPYFFEEFSDKMVKNSGGDKEHRYTIKLEMIIFGQPWLVEFSLADRKEMKYPVLIGRKFLAKKYIVDVRLKDLSFKIKKARK